MKTKLLFLFAIIVGTHCPDFIGMSLQAQDTLPDVIWSVQFNNQIPYDAKFSPDGTIIAYGLDGYIQFRNASNGEFIKQYDKNFHGGWEVTNIEFSPDGKYLFTSSGHGDDSDFPNILMWDLSADTVFHTFSPDNETQDKSAVMSMDVSPDGTRLAAIVHDKNHKNYFYLWHVLTGEILSYKVLESIVYYNHYIVKFSPDGKYLAMANPISFWIELYDANTFEYITKLGSHEQRITDIAFSPDGSLLASVGEDNKIKTYDLVNQKLIKSFNNNTNVGNLTKLSFNTSGEFLITAGNGYEKLKIWEIEDTSIVYTYSRIGLGSYGIEISSDSDKILATGGGIYLLNGKFNTISVPEEPVELKTIYPNPTNNQVVINFMQTVPAITQIKIYNGNGQEIDTIFDGFLEQGEQEIKFECSPLSIGIYFINVQVGSDITKTYKLIKQ